MHLHLFWVGSASSLGNIKKTSIEDFKADWTQLNHEFGVPLPNKVHIITNHLAEFIQCQNKPLGEFTVVEADHQRSGSGTW